MINDQWHFSRQELASQTLPVLSSGPAQALTLFAPRRTGKTEFLLKDLAPLAEESGIALFMHPSGKHHYRHSRYCFMRLKYP